MSGESKETLNQPPAAQQRIFGSARSVLKMGNTQSIPPSSEPSAQSSAASSCRLHQSAPKQLGRWGEKIALDYLKSRHYELLAAGFASRYGEIDLIVQDQRYIAFVEVKLRKSDRFGQGREYVDRRKQERLRKTAAMYLAQNPNRRQPRFDVIEIYAPEGIDTHDPVIHHLEDAFQ